ncbi:ABC transporter [Pseudohyphozyma bogoriensis]|nr:ABC transporter [Pseudohyphozyma bogoriensis]
MSDEKDLQTASTVSDETQINPASPPVETDSENEGKVDVANAASQFEQLRHSLSRISTIHKTASRDVEKGDVTPDEFDLLAYMQDRAQRRDAHGFKRKHLGVAWRGLSVKGAGGLKLWIRTFPNAVSEFFMFPLIFYMKHFKGFGTPKYLIEDFNGVARPGEMVLVLGRPGSGCSTFLKSVANQRDTYLGVEGDVTYGGITPEDISKHFKGEVVYNPEDDVHFATLTVAQTLRFALSTKTPGKHLPGETNGDFREQVLDTLFRMLGIAHTKNTKVGNAFVRGVSGGERKRVSIAEMMANSASVCSWDNSTRGLDASTALDYARSLRVLTDVFKPATFVSLYQAGEGIYDQFDKVLVIDEGRQIYFGPAKEARQYFMSLGYADLPRQTTADYLTGCTDPNERQYATGVDPETVPSTPQALEAAYRSSAIYTQVEKEREAYYAELAAEDAARQNFISAVRDDKRKGAGKKSIYTTSFFTQVKALTIRQFQIKMQDRLGLIVSFLTGIVVALITGSLFYMLPKSSAGAFTRGGVLFMCILYAFMAFAELPNQMQGRPIMVRQTGYAQYHPAALTVGATLADAPFAFVQIFTFLIIVYFMAGLYVSAGAFFTLYAIVVAGFFSLSSFFRLLGTMCESYDVAARLASFLITSFILYSGYLIPVYNMKRWLFWIYYINPVNYAFSAAMANEFGRIDLTCDGTYVVPHNVGSATKYPTTIGPNQVCTLFGAVAGTPIVRGVDYIREGYQYKVGDIWFHFGLLIVFFVGFVVLQGFCIVYLKSGGIPGINVFAKENKETKALNEELQKNKKAVRAGEVEQEIEGLVEGRRVFTFEDLTYTVPVSGGKLQLLDHVYGYSKPGTLTALMGASGAGKTTLLDVLANRKTIGVIDGSVLVDGRKLGVEFQRGTAYVEQQDVHEYTATVREAMRFSAYLRQPAHVSKAEKDAYVEEIIALLELEDFADAMIGFPGFGLDVEARKRVTIGVELAAKPQLLLFLDEPTSGLDGQSAYNIVRFLKKLAAAGQNIICTIHQPNALLFENFDRLLLLKRGGRTVYFGDIGKDCNVLRSYLARNGAECPLDANPAEFMLEAIGAGSRRRIGDKDWADIWLDSPEHAEVKAEIVRLKEEGLARPESTDPEMKREYATSFQTQLNLVARRTMLAFYRNPDYTFTRLFIHAAVALCVSLTFLNLNGSVASLQYRVFAIFFVSIIPAIIMSTVEPMFIMGRNTFIREASSKMYNTYAFSLGQLLGESPYSILCAVTFFLLLYYPMGFNFESVTFQLRQKMVLVTEFFAVTLGQAIGALCPDFYTAAMVNPLLLIMFSSFCGVTIPGPSMPYFWREWMWPLDPFTRLISGMVTTELHGLTITCTASELSVFDPPAGQTCLDWAGDYVTAAGGTLLNGSATSGCQYCQYSMGDQFYEGLQLSFDTRWRDLGILIAFTVFNALVTVVASRLLRYSKR